MLTQCLRDHEIATASLDITHWAKFCRQRESVGRPLKCRNGMDLTTPGGFGLLNFSNLSDKDLAVSMSFVLEFKRWIFVRLLLSTIMRCCDGNFIVSFGLVCSSFVAVSRGSTYRHFFLPLGNEAAPSVELGNLLASRTVPCCMYIGGCKDSFALSFAG